MTKLRSYWKSPDIKLEVNKSYIHNDEIHNLFVDNGHRVDIYEEGYKGGKKACATFEAGTYWHVRLIPPSKAEALKDKRPKLIEVTETKVEEKELLTVGWKDRDREVIQKLQPGEWTAAFEHKDFRNDIIEFIILPKNSTVSVFENHDFGGKWQDYTGPGKFDLPRGLRREISSIRFELDAWTEIREVPGKVLSKKEIGEPIVIETGLNGFPGSYTEQYVDFREAETESTNWHVNNTITATVKIGGEASTVSAEFSNSTEAGGGEDKGKEDEKSFGSKIGCTLPPAPESEEDNPYFQWNASVTSIARRFHVEQEIIRYLQNKRTGKETKQSGVRSAKRLEAHHSSNLTNIVVQEL